MDEKEKETNNLVERDERGRWKPGSTPNPLGLGAAIPKEIRLGRRILQQDFESISQQMAQMTLPDFERMRNSKTATTYQLLISTLFAKAIEGSVPHAQELLNRIIGKPKENFEISTGLEKKMSQLSQQEIEDEYKKLFVRFRHVLGGE